MAGEVPEWRCVPGAHMAFMCVGEVRSTLRSRRTWLQGGTPGWRCGGGNRPGLLCLRINSLKALFAPASSGVRPLEHPSATHRQVRFGLGIHVRAPGGVEAPVGTHRGARARAGSATSPGLDTRRRTGQGRPAWGTGAKCRSKSRSGYETTPKSLLCSKL
jgi:hypothetical protein